MTQITTRQEFAEALREKILLLACMQKGCLPCASVTPLLHMLSGLGGFLTARLEIPDSPWFTEAYGVDGSPTWIVFRGGTETGRIDPAAKSAEELADFLDGALGISLSPDALDGALAEGRRQADYLENCLAELSFRKNETSEDLLLSAIRIKVFKACLECGQQELARCVPAQIDHILDRLRAQMLTPDGATEARRGALDKLPAMAEEYIRELIGVKTRMAAKPQPNLE